MSEPDPPAEQPPAELDPPDPPSTPRHPIKAELIARGPGSRVDSGPTSARKVWDRAPPQVDRAGSVVRVLAGLSSAGFLITLDWVTDVQLTHPWLLAAARRGFAVGLVYHSRRTRWPGTT
jgi:hypothetical protein